MSARRAPSSGPSSLQLAGWASTAAFAVLVAGLWQLLVTMPAERNPCGRTWNYVSYTPVDVQLGTASVVGASAGAADVGGDVTMNLGAQDSEAQAASTYVLYKAVNNYPGRTAKSFSSSEPVVTPGAVPVLYIPGHGGSFQQARSLVAQLDGVRAPHEFDPRDPQYARDIARGLRKARPMPKPRRLRVRKKRETKKKKKAKVKGKGGEQDDDGDDNDNDDDNDDDNDNEEEEELVEEVELPPCDVFTVDFNGGELSGLSGTVARAQAAFVADAIATIALLYGGSNGKQQALVIVGHSMGGFLARAALASGRPGLENVSVSLLLTLSTPHTAPPLAAFDSQCSYPFSLFSLSISLSLSLSLSLLLSFLSFLFISFVFFTFSRHLSRWNE